MLSLLCFRCFHLLRDLVTNTTAFCVSSVVAQSCFIIILIGHSILRRPRGGASFAARAGWFASRGPSSSRRGMMNDDVGFEDDDLWETVVNGSVAGGERDGDAESAIEALAMEVSGVESGFMSSRNRLTDGRHRVLDWARVFSQAGRDSLHSGVDPSHLLRTATENAAHYCPIWVKSSSLIASRIRSSASNPAMIGIEIGSAEQMNVAHLPIGATEGKPRYRLFSN